MRKLSQWGKNNPVKARVIITLGHVFLVFNAFALGILSYVNDITVAWWVPLVLGNLFFLAYFFYPIKGAKEGLFRHSYGKQKALDFILISSYAMLISAGLNHWASTPIQPAFPSNPNAVLIAQKLRPEAQQEALSQKDKKANVRATIQSVKANLKALKAELKAAQGSGKGWLIALTIVLALGVGYLITGLACGIMCSGQEGLGWAALIVGWAGLIWLTVIMIKKIARRGATS